MWINHLQSAAKLKVESESELDLAVQSLARSLGFTKEESLKFHAEWTTGQETSVHYDDSTGNLLSDLDITRMNCMTKEEVLKYFSRFS